MILEVFGSETTFTAVGVIVSIPHNKNLGLEVDARALYREYHGSSSSYARSDESEDVTSLRKIIF